MPSDSQKGSAAGSKQKAAAAKSSTPKAKVPSPPKVKPAAATCPVCGYEFHVGDPRL